VSQTSEKASFKCLKAILSASIYNLSLTPVNLCPVKTVSQMS
jgi:hypothetical protein